MKKFIIDIFTVLFSFILFSIVMMVIGYFFIGNQYSENYQASLINKVSRLKKTKSPKIILVGDSNLTFGVDSYMLEDMLDMEVVNLGVHAKLGNKFMENVTKENINKGDIVVVSNVDFEDYYFDPEIVWITIEWNFDLWKYIPKDKYLTMYLKYPSYMYKSFKESVNGHKTNQGTVYLRKNINKYGDFNDRPEVIRYVFKEGDSDVPKINNTYIKRMNKFNNYVNSQEASLVLTAYPIGNGAYSPELKEYDAFQKQLENKLDFPVISRFTDYYIPYKYFYDTKYHLTLEGRELRTKRLILDLMGFMSSNK